MKLRVLIFALISVFCVGLFASALPASASILPPGNPNGVVPVPAAGQAADTSSPNHVVGTGTPASCTSAEVIADVAAGGITTFNCGPNPVTIIMTAPAVVANTEQSVVLDGGGLVTLDGGGKNRILFSDTCAGTWSTDDCVNQAFPKIVVQNLQFRDGYDGTQQVACTQNIPQCWYGGVNGGGAIYAEGGQFKAVNDTFIDNSCYAYGPDLGGGALRVLAQYDDDPVYVVSTSLIGNSCSNGGAISSIDTNWDILNSTLHDNSAVGWGSNPAAAGTPGGGSGGAIYNDGDNYNTNVEGSMVNYNTAREGGGAAFFVIDSGSGTLTFDESQLYDNISGEYETYPGVYDNHSSNGQDGPPVMIDSTDVNPSLKALTR